MINKVLCKIVDKIDFENQSQTVSYLNIYNYQILRSKSHLIREINFFTLDGIMLVFFLRLLTSKKLIRQSPDFSSYFKDLFAYLDVNKKRVFFIGASENDLLKFVNIIKTKYPNIEISGFLSGYNLRSNIAQDQIISNKVDTLIVGMGTPNQEEFITKVKLAGYKGSSFACGAFFSQTANNGLQYYPSWISKIHLRWIYRIYKEPKLVKRYLIDYPIGLYFLLSDRFS